MLKYVSVAYFVIIMGTISTVERRCQQSRMGRNGQHNPNRLVRLTDLIGRNSIEQYHFAKKNRKLNKAGKAQFSVGLRGSNLASLRNISATVSIQCGGISDTQDHLVQSTPAPPSDWYGDHGNLKGEEAVTMDPRNVYPSLTLLLSISIAPVLVVFLVSLDIAIVESSILCIRDKFRSIYQVSIYLATSAKSRTHAHW